LQTLLLYLDSAWLIPATVARFPRGRGGEAPRRKRLWGLTVPLIPGGVSHFRSNQPAKGFVLKAKIP